MKSTVEEIKNQLQAMLDKTETKEDIEQIGVTNSLLDKLESEHKELQSKYNDLFKDYRELVKHTSFVPNGNETQEVQEQKNLSFDTFLSDYKNNNKH